MEPTETTIEQARIAELERKLAAEQYANLRLQSEVDTLTQNVTDALNEYRLWYDRWQRQCHESAVIAGKQYMAEMWRDRWRCVAHRLYKQRDELRENLSNALDVVENARVIRVGKQGVRAAD